MVQRAGARTELLGAADIDLPMYVPDGHNRTSESQHLVRTIARADGLIISTPGYHGGISGLVKNALDYLEDLRDAVPPYLDGTVVGCIVCASGWQATTTTLTSLRGVVHALRGWPSPLGVTINSEVPLLDSDGRVLNEAVANQLEIMVQQVVEFAGLRMRAAS